MKKDVVFDTFAKGTGIFIFDCNIEVFAIEYPIVLFSICDKIKETLADIKVFQGLCF